MAETQKSYQELLAETVRLRSELMIAEERAKRDEVTGLYRRWYFMARVAKDIEEFTKGSERHDAPNPECSVFMVLDLVDFSRFNNSPEGQPAGDRILQQSAVAMRRVLRRGEKLGRLGGDEFGLWLLNMSPDVVAAKISQINASLAKEDPTLSAYFGFVFYSREMSVDDLYRAAAAEMSEAKRVSKEASRG